MKKINVTVNSSKQVPNKDKAYIIDKVMEIKNKLGFKIKVEFI